MLQLCNFAHNVPSQKKQQKKTTKKQKKAMLTVCNRNTRKRCLLISKKTLKTSEQRYLTASYLLDVTVQKHILDSFS